MALKRECKRFCSKCGGEIHKVLDDGRIQFSPTNCICSLPPGTPPSSPRVYPKDSVIFIDNSEVGKSRKAYPSMYAMLWPAVVEECRARGYAAALHGSLAKDMDVLAVPWTAEAVSPAELAEAVAERLGCFYGDHLEGRGPTKKPHGRLCWTLLLSGHAYIDFSVFPPTDNQ